MSTITYLSTFQRLSDLIFKEVQSLRSCNYNSIILFRNEDQKTSMLCRKLQTDFWMESWLEFCEDDFSSQFLICGSQPVLVLLYAINIFHTVEVLVSAKQLKDMVQELSMALEEELKVPDFVLWINYFFLLLCFWIFTLLWFNLLFGFLKNMPYFRFHM